VTTKTLQVIAFAVCLAGAFKAPAQRTLTSAPNRRLTKANDYRKVAAYFRTREMAFRAKAQGMLN
jgi:hypothetical protein